jgi:AraC family transcriptional regulator, transcriptional activator of pobA
VKPKRTTASAPNAGFAELLEVARRLRFERHNIAGHLDGQGHYEVSLDEEFPFLIKLFHYSSRHHTRGPTWHERLELFTPLDGPARFQMADQVVHLGRGDVLVVDNLKLHNVLDFPGFNTRTVVISFMPEFVYSLGSPSFDYAFLLPFYSKLEKHPNVVQASEAASADVCHAMASLLRCYFAPGDRPFLQAGCKAFFLQMLYHMARHFRGSELLRWELVRQQQRSVRLKKLFEHVTRNYPERLTVTQAAALAGMSQPQFMKTFKKVAGMTLIAYLNHVRLSNAVRLLRETDLSIADIAARVGFTDQSYFDKRFKRAFGNSPRQFRLNQRAPGAG